MTFNMLRTTVHVPGFDDVMLTRDMEALHIVYKVDGERLSLVAGKNEGSICLTRGDTTVCRLCPAETGGSRPLDRHLSVERDAPVDLIVCVSMALSLLLAIG